ncbi:M28 family peptidase [Nocardioides sp. Root140]|uniref:M28 family peptidase n=1 Tax=Nocardioides sp. Root140 TaxID=1736460 RepID=UPI0009EAEEAB|nr:M28 family peptidase [Nocardioides sp. Root140]
MTPARTRIAALAGIATLAAGVALALPGSATALPGGATVDPQPAAVADAPDIPLSAVTTHLEEFQSIAEANGGNRYTGQPGYRASLDYVQAQLDAAGFVTEVQSFSTRAGTSYNLIADWPGGDTTNTVMMGGHLDSVDEGPGINDNGTGSAAILASALAFAQSGAEPANHVRFGFWGAEELGLLGSTHYVDSLSTVEVDDLAAYFNFDMVGSPNPGYFVYDDDANGTELRDSLTASYDAAGIDSDYIDVDGRSDHAAFMQRGIPTAGTFSGAEGTKTSTQAAKWGGQAGQAYDPCYHSACDDIDNLDTAALDLNADLIADTLWAWADHDFGGGTTEPPTGDDAITNGGFEDGTTGWQATNGVVSTDLDQSAHGGSGKAWLNGYGRAHTDSVAQTVTVPDAGRLTFWLRVDTDEDTTGQAYDTLRVKAGSTTLGTWSNLDAGDYRSIALDLSAYAGQSVTVTFVGTEDAYLATDFVLDDVSLTSAG